MSCATAGWLCIECGSSTYRYKCLVVVIMRRGVIACTNTTIGCVKGFQYVNVGNDVFSDHFGLRMWRLLTLVPVLAMRPAHLKVADLLSVLRHTCIYLYL